MFKASNLLTWKWTIGLCSQQHEATCTYVTRHVDVLHSSPGRSKQPSAEGSRWPPSTEVFLGFSKETVQVGGFYRLKMVRNYVLIQMLLASFPKFCWLYLDHPGVARCPILGISMDFKHHHTDGCWTSYRIVVGWWDDISLPLSSLHSLWLETRLKRQNMYFLCFKSQKVDVWIIFLNVSAPIFDDWFRSPQRDDSRCVICIFGKYLVWTVWTKSCGRSTKS